VGVFADSANSGCDDDPVRFVAGGMGFLKVQGSKYNI